MSSLTDETMRNFWTKVDMSGECWLWTAAKERSGYGLWSPPKATGLRMSVAHRFAYMHKVGPIPKGLDLDHLCKNKSCVNPGHLEPVTHQENVRRAHAHRTHCKQGHERTPENWVERANGHYYCRACSRERQALSLPMVEPIDVDGQYELIIDAIREQMGRRRAGQVEIAARAGVSQGTVSRWLSGRGDMRVPELLKVCAALDMALADFDLDGARVA